MGRSHIMKRPVSFRRQEHRIFGQRDRRERMAGIDDAIDELCVGQLPNSGGVVATAADGERLAA